MKKTPPKRGPPRLPITIVGPHDAPRAIAAYWRYTTRSLFPLYPDTNEVYRLLIKLFISVSAGLSMQ
jgi:hypothetical protein